MQELDSFGELSIAGVGFNEIGEIRLRIGDLDGAEEAFAQAHQRGNDAQPGLALLELARGRPVVARSSIRNALAEQPIPLIRARLLPAQVEIALASHDATEARDAAEELGEIASTFDAPLWHASAHQALGVVLTYEGDLGRDRRAPEGGASLDRGRPPVRDRAGTSMPRDGPPGER